MPISEIAAWFTENPDLGEILDRKGEGPSNPVLISEHKDELLFTGPGYGKATKPEDYLAEFKTFIESKTNDIPALITVVTRPRDLTRRQLRELLLELDKAGFSEANLSAAWKQMTNQEIAARIVGYIRQAALGDPLIPSTSVWIARFKQCFHRVLGQIHSASGCKRSLLRPRPTCSWTARHWMSRAYFQTRRRRFSPSQQTLRGPALAGSHPV